MKTMDELVAWFQINFPKLVKEMKNSSHHFDEKNLNPYHLEDDIFTHSLLVCLQARHSDPVIQMAALLHDIGKPFVRQVKETNGHVYFTNHESVSAFMALDVLKKVDWLNSEEKIQIFRAICHHTDVFKLTEKQLNELFTDEPVLAHIVRDLSICDHLGRFTSVPSELPEIKPNIKSPRPKKDKDVVIMVGLPASGKSTRTEELRSQGYFVVSSDEIIEELCPDMTYNQAYHAVNHDEVDKLFRARLKESLKHDKVVVDTTNLSKKRRKGLIENFKKNYNVHGEVMLVPMSVLEERNKERTKKGKHIPSSVYEKMIKSFYCPSISEGFDTLEFKLFEG